jgi:mannitol-1-phosphate/altronate dehydrogenase
MYLPDVADIERTAQEDYETACEEYHEWWIEQREIEERALLEQATNDAFTPASLQQLCGVSS